MENQIPILTISRVPKFWTAVLIVAVAALTVWSLVSFGVVASALLLAVPVVMYWIVKVFRDPRVGVITLFVVNYFMMGVSRYLPGPLGLAVDGVMAVTYVAIVFQSINRRGMWKPAATDLTLLAAVWYLYAIFEFFNPEVASRSAWFYAMRGFSLYFLMAVPLVFMVFNQRRDMDLFFKLLSIFTLLAVAKGLMQKFGYIDPWEQQWLLEGGAKTHMVAGRLRVFSFFTDAGQYGGAMGYAGVVFSIASMSMRGRQKWYYLAVAAMAFVGMMISGTRGSMAVPAVGFMLFVILSGRVKQQIAMLVVIVAIFGFFKFTHIGDSNYTVARMRTAFNGTKDASMAVRLINQQKLATYLHSRPFGGGIGSSGNWGQRFAPNSFLANVPTDSWYVSIWAEQGIVGLGLHLFILIYVLIRGSIITLKIKDDDILVYKLRALLCGFAGVMVASYSNGVIGQMPTGIIVYMSLAFIFMAPRWVAEQQRQKQAMVQSQVDTKM